LFRPLLIAVLLLVASPAFADASAPIEVARTALSDSRWDDALQAAEGALRADPGNYEAILLKALAYEGRGDLDRAESLLVAIQELAAGRRVPKEANDALDRVRTSRDTGPQAEATRSATEADVVVDLQLRSSLDAGEVEALTQRVAEAVEAGRCMNAMADAKSIVDAAFEDPRGWALLGDARRCAGDTLGAVDAYRRARALGSDDPGVLVVLRGLEASFGEVRVAVIMDRPFEVPRVLLRLGDSVRRPDFRRGGETVFRDLDPTQAMTLIVSGLGTREEVRALDPLSPGEQRRVEVETTYVGVGSLRLGPYELTDCRVRVRAEDGPEVSPGVIVEVTAGRAPVFVQNEYGTLMHRVHVAAGELVDLDPIPLVPSTLTVVGLPVGATVRAYVDGAHEGTYAERELRVPREGATVDEETGVLIAPPLKMGPLMGGSGGLFLEHPRLGVAAADVSLQPGRVNATTFGWRDLAGVDGVRDEFTRWKNSQPGRQSMRAPKWVPPLAVGIGSALAAGALLAGGGLNSNEGLLGGAAGTGVASGVAFGVAIGVAVASPPQPAWSAWRPDGF
jgi:hypothetical protein